MSQPQDPNQPQNQPVQQPQAAGSTGQHPEHEPLAFHFGNFKEAIAQVEQQEAQTPPEVLPSPLANQPYTPPIVQSNSPSNSIASTTQQTAQPPHPPLPLSDQEIESNAHSKKLDNSLHWLALWCIRQLEIYEKTLNQNTPTQNS